MMMMMITIVILPILRLNSLLFLLLAVLLFSSSSFHICCHLIRPRYWAVMSTKSTPDNLFQTKVSIYIAISLDGFIARPDGSLDWLPGSDGSSTSDDATNTFESFMDSVDVIIMGLRTFDFVVKPKRGLT
jgi:hypothetical protein